jgi:hypothetical protein
LTWFDVPGECNRIWNGGSDDTSCVGCAAACTDTDQMAGCILGGGTAVNAGLWWNVSNNLLYLRIKAKSVDSPTQKTGIITFRMDGSRATCRQLLAEFSPASQELTLRRWMVYATCKPASTSYQKV